MAWRYAIYIAPPADHPLWQAGSAWLGRDARAGQPHGHPPAGRVDAWRYGFHATLKAPIRLRDDRSESSWLDAVAALARRHRAFTLPSLQVAMLSDFAALRPISDPARESPLRRLADDCVQALDAFRAPLDEAQRARRRSALGTDLDGRRAAALERWGYPHVFDDWRFHFTLTDRVPPGEDSAALLAAAAGHFSAALTQPLVCDSVSVFVEPAPGAPFELAWRFALAAP